MRTVPENRRCYGSLAALVAPMRSGAGVWTYRRLAQSGGRFHPDLTGRENVFVSGVIAGLTRREIAQRLMPSSPSLSCSSLLRAFRTYSTGMQMRLAFAIAVHTMPEVLFIDEVLAVGDLMFQRKCIERIGQFKAEGQK